MKRLAAAALSWSVVAAGCSPPPKLATVAAAPAASDAVPAKTAAPAERAARAETQTSPPVASADSKEAPAPPVEALPPVRHPFHEVLPSKLLPKDAPAMRNANLSPSECRRELARRKLAVQRERRGHKGVADAVRVTGPLSGVEFWAPRSPSPYGLLDCRLALTLDDFAKVLSEHQVARVRIDNLYRAGARLPGRRKKSQHGYGLAIDIVGFVTRDGETLSVEDDWGSSIGSSVCGPDALLEAPSERAVALRNLVCAVARAGLFHHLLTPSYDAAHRDHLHFDIKRGEKTLLVK